MSRHDGVSCDACMSANFKGRRYKCLVCYDYDLCAKCTEDKVVSSGHLVEHPMQCILTKHDHNLFYGGENLSVSDPQSLTCPFCGKFGLTESTLREHVQASHQLATGQVVCPICASVPGGDPNFVTDNFMSHMNMEHSAARASSSNAAENPSQQQTGRTVEAADLNNSSSRHNPRRMQYPSRGMGRAVPRRNLTFGGNVPPGGIFPISRDSSGNMDPIAELLSQLTGARRSTIGNRLNATWQDGAERRTIRRGSTILNVVTGGEGGQPSGAVTNTSSRLAAYSSLLDGQGLVYGALVGGERAAATTASTPKPVTGSSAAAAVTDATKRPTATKTATPATTPATAADKTATAATQGFVLSRVTAEDASVVPSDLEQRAAFARELVWATLYLDTEPSEAVNTLTIEEVTTTDEDKDVVADEDKDVVADEDNEAEGKEVGEQESTPVSVAVDASTQTPPVCVKPSLPPPPNATLRSKTAPKVAPNATGCRARTSSGATAATNLRGGPTTTTNAATNSGTGGQRSVRTKAARPPSSASGTSDGGASRPR